ncbi:MAG: hypothetical protein IPL36_04990 [Nigerium sp.]|nr:hypothetical protein [Nigerium sp.]
MSAYEMTLVADAYFSLAAALASLIAARHPDRERRAAWERAAVTCGVIAASVGCIGIVIGAQRSRRWPGSAGTGHAWARLGTPCVLYADEDEPERDDWRGR